MKRIASTYSKSSLFVLVILITFIVNSSFGQEDKKNASLSVQYFKIMKENSYLDLSAKFKGKNGFEPCTNLNFTIYKVDTTGVIAPAKIGEIKTNKDGKAKFIIPTKYITPSTSYSVKLENNKVFEDNEGIVSVNDVTIEASLEKTDSIYSIKARLVTVNNKPIVEESLNVGLKRLFGNLPIGGEESYSTDEDGSILVPIDQGLTGINGKLNFQVVIPESEKYGTVIANVNTGSGVPIVDKSSFNERTMWSPPTKTPYFLLIIPNVLLIGIWGILTLLIINLFKIYKSKN